MRIEGAFLGAHDFDHVSRVLDRLRSALHWHCVRPYLDAAGWTVHGELGFRDGHEWPPEQVTMQLSANATLEVGVHNFLFAERDGERAVFGVLQDHDCFFLSVRTSRCPDALWGDWHEFTRKHNPLRLKAFLPDGKYVVTGPGHSWDALFLDGGPAAQIQFQLRRFLSPLQATLRDLGIRRRSGIILTGPPGTGKTLIGKILARTLEATMLWVTPAYLRRPQDVVEVMDVARFFAPVILFLEDIDVLAEDRERNAGAAALGELMNQLDGCMGDGEIFAIATTNRLHVLEGALRNRPGRFDRVIEVPAPGAGACVEMVRARLGTQRIEDEDLQWLCRSVKGRTGAEIEELCNTVLMCALERQGSAAVPPLELPREVLTQALEMCPQANRGAELGF